MLFRSDGETINRDEMLAICARIAARVRSPVSADLEAGYGPTPEDMATTIRGALAAGIVGCNIEDGTHRREQPLYPLDLAVARVRAVRREAERAGIPFVINARTDSYLAAMVFGAAPDSACFDETVRRGRAFRDAGADCIFIPGLADRDTIGRLVAAIGGPINILVGAKSPTVPELKALGVKRVSVGGMLMLATLGLVRRAVAELRETGSYGFAAGMVMHAEMNKMLGD